MGRIRLLGLPDDLCDGDVVRVKDKLRVAFDPGPQERLEPPLSGTAQLVRWAPSSLTYRVSLGWPGTLVVNQAWDRGWRGNRPPLAQRSSDSRFRMEIGGA